MAGVVILVAMVLLKMSASRDPGQDGRETEVPVEGRQVNQPASVSSDTSEISVNQGPVADTVDGRAPYDTGIENDGRVIHTEDGKHVFIEAIGIANEMTAPDVGPEQSMEKFGEVLSFYRMNFEENPVASDNQSVMASLMGANPRGLVFFPQDHPSLNGDRELVDRWGTPYYFHALSGKLMEVVSPGPDRKLGNDDDLIHTQRDSDDFFSGFTEPPPDPAEE